MKHRTWTRTCANAMMAVVVSAGLTLPSTALLADESTSSSFETNDIVDMKNLFTSEEESDDIDKSETVYIFTNPDGTPKNTLVSNWLANPQAAAELVDASNLTDIENTEGDETFTQNGSMLTWNAKGKDIYYRGSTSASAPIKISVTYTLNGQTISPEELAGKSGDVTIRYDFTNLSTTTRTVKGSQTTFYTPFACVTALIMDNDVFSNIKVTNGRVMKDSNRSTIIGMAFPGLKEDLDISDEDADVPDYFEVSATATNFELDTAATLVSPGLMNNLNPDAIDTDSMGDSLNQLGDAMSALEDGSSELYKGLEQLAKGAETLDDGVGALSSEISDLPAQANQLADGSQSITDGLAGAASGAKKLAKGAGSLDDGIELLAGGLQTAVDAIGAGSSDSKTLYGAALALQNGLSQLRGGAKDASGSLYAAKNGASTLATNTAALASGTQEAINAIGGMSDTSEKTVQGALNIAKSQLGDTASLTEALKALQGAAVTLEGLSGDARAAGTALQNASIALGSLDFDSAISAMNGVADDIDASQYTEVANALAALDGMSLDDLTPAQKTAIENAKAALNKVDTDKLANAASDARSAANDLTTAKTNIASIAMDINAAAQTYATAATSLASAAETLGKIDASAAANTAAAAAIIEGAQKGLDGIAAGLKSAKNGADVLAEGASSLSDGLGDVIDTIDSSFIPGMEGLKNGLTLLSDGDGKTSTGLAGAVAAIGDSKTPGTLAFGTHSLVVNLDPLAQGLIDAKKGSNKLTSGLESFAESAPDMVAGIKALKKGASALASGAREAAKGSQQLSDGIKTLDDEAISKIIDAYNNDLVTLSDRLRATVQAGKDYQTFSGKVEGAKGDVKFIYEIDPIEIH